MDNEMELKGPIKIEAKSMWRTRKPPLQSNNSMPLKIDGVIVSKKWEDQSKIMIIERAD